MDSSTAVKSFIISDDLELSSIRVAESPKGILFPEELNNYLRDQIKYLTHENGMLHKNLQETEISLKHSKNETECLTNQIQEHQQVANSKCSFLTNGICNDIASKKIVELSKKLRERNSELALFKTKCSKLEQEIYNLQRSDIKVEEPEKPKNELEEQVKLLQDKFSSTNTKLCEARNSNTQLKNELKLLNKLLQQEVGDGMENVQSLINTNWRGRAQIICDLQQKCNNLREKLKAYQDKDKGHINDVLPPSKTDKRLEGLIKENAELKNSVQDYKKKFEASKARNKVYESESTVLKTKVSLLVEQSDRDSQTITSLTAKVSCAQELQNEALQKKQSLIQKLEQDNKNYQIQLAKHECKIDNLKTELEQRRHEMEHFKTNSRLSSAHSLELPLIPNDCKTMNKLEAERLRLLELVKTTNDRLELERSAHTETLANFRAERQKAAKLETKVARLQLEHQTDRSNYSSYSLTKMKDNDNSQDRLQLAEETIKSLETKLQLKTQEHKADIIEFSRILSEYSFVKPENKRSE